MGMEGLTEPLALQDIFVSGLGAIEQIGGGCLRFYLYVLQSPPCGDGPPEKVVVAKIIAPATAVPDAVLKMMGAVGTAALNVVPMIGDLLH